MRSRAPVLDVPALVRARAPRRRSARLAGLAALAVACGGAGADLAATDDAAAAPAPSDEPTTPPDDAPPPPVDAGVEPTPTTGPDAEPPPDAGPDVDGGPRDGGPPPPTPTALRIMSFNIKYGSVVGLDLSKIADVVKTNAPDLLGLQEVDELTNRSGKKAETDELARLTGMPYRYFGAAFDFDGGKYGGAILSKYPLVNARTVRLDAHTTRGNGIEPRIAVAADVTLGTRTVTFVSLHASLVAGERDGNGLAVVNALGARASRAIVVGDFNENPNQALGNRLKGVGMVDTFAERHPFALGFTAPANFPTRRIDFVYRGSAFGATRHAWVSDTRASDHRPAACVVPMD